MRPNTEQPLHIAEVRGLNRRGFLIVEQTLQSHNMGFGKVNNIDIIANA